MTSHPNPTLQEAQDWSDCQKGEISGLVHRLKRTRAQTQRRQLLKATAVAAGMLVMVGSLWMLSAGTAPSAPDRLTCRQVYELDQQYIHHELSPEMEARILAHLKRCPPCEKHIHSLTSLPAESLSGLVRPLLSAIE